MHARLSPVSGTLRRLAALALVFWLAGVGCVLGCEMKVSAAPAVDSEPVVEGVEGDSCPAFSDGNCCHKSATTGPLSFGSLPFEQKLPSCCPFAKGAADPPRKASKLEAPAEATEKRFASTQRVKTTLRLPARSPLIPDRGGTHLLCCVFLI